MKIIARIDVELEAECEKEVDNKLNSILTEVSRIGNTHRCSLYVTDQGFEDADLEKELRRGLYQ